MTQFYFRGIIIHAMDNTNKITNQNQNIVFDQKPLSAQPQTQLPGDQNQIRGQTQTQQQPQAGSGGTLVKERELPATSSAGPSVSEFVKPSGHEAEPMIPDELEKIGVGSVREFQKVGPEEQKIGIKESMPPVRTEPVGLVQTPMTEEEARQTLKNAKTSESRWGLAALIVKFFKSIHHKLLTNKG